MSQYSFGPFTYDRTQQTLSDGEKTVSLSPINAGLLTCLIDSEIQPVSEETIKKDLAKKGLMSINSNLTPHIKELKDVVSEHFPEEAETAFIENLREVGYYLSARKEELSDVIEFEHIKIDKTFRSLETQGYKIQLSKQQLAIFLKLLENPNKIYTNADVKNILENAGFETHSATASGIFSNVNLKLKQAGANDIARHITTNVSGKGYVLTSHLHITEIEVRNTDIKESIEKAYALHRKSKAKPLNITVKSKESRYLPQTHSKPRHQDAAKKTSSANRVSGEIENPAADSKTINAFGPFKIDKMGTLSFTSPGGERVLARFEAEETLILTLLFNHAASNENRAISLNDLSKGYYRSHKGVSPSHIEAVRSRVYRIMERLQRAAPEIELEKLIEVFRRDDDQRASLRLNPAYRPKIK